MSDSTPYSHGMADLTITGEISKVDEDKRQVFGWASVTEIDGEPVVDLQNDLLDTYELEKAAYDYVLHSRVGGAMHERVGKSSPKQVGTLIESFVVTPEKIEKMGLPSDTPRGWWIGFKVDDEEVWKSVKDKKFTGFSIHGVGKRQPVEKSVMTRTKQEYDGWLKRMAHIVGTDPDSIDLHLKQWMESEGKPNPSDDDIHGFLMTAYKDGDPHGEVTKTIAKHLIGRHDQMNHDPTKRRRHSRKEHGAMREARANLKRLKSRARRMDEPELVRDLTEAGRIMSQGDRGKLSPAEVIAAVGEIDAKWRKKVEKSMDSDDTKRLFLLSKVAENSKSEEEAASHVASIAKALEEVGKEELANYFSEVHKHLIGRHKQEDHDPTKKGKGHKRKQHGGKWGTEGTKTGAKIGTALGAGVGAIGAASMMRLGANPLQAARPFIGGGAGGALAGYNIGGGQIFGNVDPNAGGGRRFGAGLANTLQNPLATGTRRLIHGDPNAYYRQQRSGKRRKKMSKGFTDREREVLSKYLGKDFL